MFICRGGWPPGCSPTVFSPRGPAGCSHGTCALARSSIQSGRGVWVDDLPGDVFPSGQTEEPVLSLSRCSVSAWTRRSAEAADVVRLPLSPSSGGRTALCRGASHPPPSPRAALVQGARDGRLVTSEKAGSPASATRPGICPHTLCTPAAPSGNAGAREPLTDPSGVRREGPTGGGTGSYSR